MKQSLYEAIRHVISIPESKQDDFKSWFGKSVLHTNGIPHTFYHGTSSDIEKFDHAFVGKGADSYGAGFYFSNKPEIASSYAYGGNSSNVIPVHIRMEKPIIYNEDEKPLSRLHIQKLITSAPNHKESLENFGDVSYEGYHKVLNQAVDAYKDRSKFQAMGTIHRDFYGDNHKEFLENFTKITGHDGVIVKYDDHIIANVFHPNQIKSAIGSGYSKKSDNLIEAIQDPAHKAMATKASNSTKYGGLTAAERVSKDKMPNDTIVIDLERPKNAKPNSEVVHHLNTHGYNIAGNYSDGLAAHESTPNRKIKIGKILELTKASTNVKTLFETDPARQGIYQKDDGESKRAKIVISRNPHVVAGLSTHENSDSCLTLGGPARYTDRQGNKSINDQKRGAQAEKVPHIVASGAHVAFLTNDPDKIHEHYNKIARQTLNVFYSNEGGKPIIRPTGQIYGNEWAGFTETLQKHCEENYPATDAEYTLHHDAYQEGPTKIRNFDSKHDEYWKDQSQDTFALEHHPDPDVIHHLVSKAFELKYSHGVVAAMKNPNMSDYTRDEIFRKVAIKDDNNPMKSSHFKSQIAQYAKTPEQIQPLLDSTFDSPIVSKGVSKNVNSSPEQLHQVLNTWGAGATNIPGVRKLVGNYSHEIIHNIIHNPNSDDTHLASILQAKELNEKNPSTGMIDLRGHDDTMDFIASKYKDHEIGKKLINITNDSGILHSRVISYVAEKSPHLLHLVPDDKLGAAYSRHSGIPNLETEMLQRGTPDMLASVASATKNEDLLDSFVKHPNSKISSNAIFRKRTLSHYNG